MFHSGLNNFVEWHLVQISVSVKKFGQKQKIGKLATTEDGRMLIIGYGQNADKLLIVTTNKSEKN